MVVVIVVVVVVVVVNISRTTNLCVGEVDLMHYAQNCLHIF